MSTAIATERVPLSFLLAQNASEEPPVEPLLPFPAWREHPSPGGPDWLAINVTSLLERTAAFHTLGDRYDTGVLRLDLVYVDPGAVSWQAKVFSRQELSKLRSRRSSAAISTGVNSHEQSRQLALRRGNEQARREEIAAFTADQAEGETMPPEVKTCRRCGKSKPRDEFAATGIYGGYCSTCEPIEKAERAAARVSSTPKKARTIPAESKPKPLQASKPLVLPLANGHGDTVSDALVNLVKNLIAERNTLRAQLDAIEAALVHA